MMDRNPCTSYVPASICNSGFPLRYPASSACTGHVCMSCGRPNDIVPSCQREDLPSMWLNEDGSPKFAPKDN